ncbi:xanthosine utilization system XapX-like protein [Lipingzhangella halophila]|uniref:Xanthosine utilization system XapX-like protein n=1 Tax=Lipingzhangella halophila TaxID=1783352 RepID=A0A7W7RF31_9ACTN|nr:hypothetical protein [Lipingzhangella halophila]MBB4930786.1 xanthosine utilization system XapX-like protein [Lipingzhangella halophila]
MEFLYSSLVFLHLLGMAGILSGFLMQLMTESAKAPKSILHSSLLQLVTGLLLVGVAEMGAEAEINHFKIGVKLLVALVVAVVALLDVRKPTTGLAATAGALAILNVGIAVFW